jgi:hypothetical protein
MYCTPIVKIELNCQSVSSLYWKESLYEQTIEKVWSLASDTFKLKNFAEV